MGNAAKLWIAAVLVAVGVLEHALRRGSIGVALIVFGLALVGIVVQDRLSGPGDERRRRRRR